MLSKILKLFNFSSSIPSISTQELSEKLKKKSKDVVLLDVRTPEEFNAGHISHAINADVRSVDFGKKLRALDKNKTYYVYCRSGMRSQQACKIMTESGFKQAINVKGGFLSWKNL